MKSRPSVHPADVLGFSRLAIDATTRIADMVEAMHGVIAHPGPLAAGPTALAYKAVRAIARLTGSSIDAALAPLIEGLGERPSVPKREAMLAAVNGIMGDYLAATGNPLAIQMRLRRSGQPLRLKRKDLAAAIPQAGGKLLVLVHGLCMNDLQWTHHRHSHGANLAAELGWTPVHLHYNSGLHVSTNGREFAGLLETLVKQWPAPVRELAILSHSGGGLVSRSACYYGAAAGHRWLKRLHKLIFLGVPHHGSALERGGNWVNVMLGLSPYSAPLARITMIRSAGITDLRYGSLLDEDWEGKDRFRHSRDHRRPVPLPEGVRCSAAAASLCRKGTKHGREVLGDGLVSLDSALGRHKDPALTLPFAKSDQWVGHAMNHWDLLSRPGVYRRIRTWMEA